jgi:hypothetical protein
VRIVEGGVAISERATVAFSAEEGGKIRGSKFDRVKIGLRRKSSAESRYVP